MRRLTSCLLLALLAACSHSATGPKGEDPTALVVNGSADPVIWTWFDGQSVSGRDSIPAGATRCEQFTAQADSARFQMADSVRIKASGAGWYTYDSNWFDPASRPDWVITISGGADLVADTSAAPC